MLKKIITYKNLDGDDVTETFYFHLSKAEITEMELSEEGGLAEKLKTIIATNDRPTIIATFKMLISKTVGRRSEDGKRFIKTQEITDEFMQTDAFSELFMELVSNTEAAAQFIVGVVPADISDKLTEVATREIKGIEDVQLPSEEKTFDDFTDDELLEMSDEDYHALRLKIKGNNIPKRILLIGQRRKAKE